ncbi:hypothetical protein ACM6Q7_13400 [Peribacillus butanolivorans]
MAIVKPFMASRKFTATIGDGTGTDLHWISSLITVQPTRQGKRADPLET